MAGLWISTILITGWILLGSWVAVFPDTLERLFGVGYDFKDTWGVTAGRVRGAHARNARRSSSRSRLIGYWFGQAVRADGVTVPIEAVIPPSPLV